MAEVSLNEFCLLEAPAYVVYSWRHLASSNNLAARGYVISISLTENSTARRRREADALSFR